MREILFRGKRVGNGEWVEGYFFRRFGSNEMVTADNDIYHVDPETIGQYTGLKGRSGTRIFEGDCFKTYCTGLPVYRHIVRYYPEHFAFMARCIERNTVHYLSDYSPSAIEVIGNIHDNPKLLEREHNE